MTEEEAPRRGTARRVLLACAVLAAAGLTAFGVRHTQTAPDGTATANWAAACRGRDGNDMRRLVGGSPTAVLESDLSGTTVGDDVTVSEFCKVSVADGSAAVTVESLHPDSVAGELAALTRPVAHTRRITAGTAARVSSAGATALVTCHSADGTRVDVKLRVMLHGSVTHNPDRSRLMENITRRWARAIQGSENCGVPV